MKMWKWVVPAVMVTGIWGWAVGAPVRGDVIIDSFQDRPSEFPLIAGSGAGTLLLPSAYPDVIGGRAMALGPGQSGAPDAGALTADITNTGGSSFRSYDSMKGDEGFLQISYGTTNVASGPSAFYNGDPMELTVDGTEDVLRLSFLSYNHADGQDMQMEILLGTGLDSEATILSIPAILTTAGAQVIDIPLTGLPSTTLNSVSVKFVVPPGTAFELDTVALVDDVPEPGTMAMLAVPALLLLRRGG